MITMDAFSAYKIYMGLKAHFNSDYDFKKYSGKTTASKSSYLKRKDKFFFGKVSRRYGEKVKDFFVSNFLKNERGYICLLYTSPSPRDQRGSGMPWSG